MVTPDSTEAPLASPTCSIRLTDLIGTKLTRHLVSLVRVLTTSINCSALGPSLARRSESHALVSVQEAHRWPFFDFERISRLSKLDEKMFKMCTSIFQDLMLNYRVSL
ncbi:BZ3500_MvSof-1268-A1-R1_Chr2-1g04209 [Microbotryum saponariae]|uniref:BZ3500_MvSof-1268-A1-R1_Chr2-1g04209 protein n=1 Tax=Microbotryum saponariae TaxID=289078 RepID=A0A2X0M1X7_9BASI|nr:BZ3500_MvSof-1268-A1-R1_Chr2-1g04209 [Microbotryum saponariae]SCZ91196.1 BZ3501_MvSof-1269-A2-R1_Chr2-1g03865 [Microbotryum saponariae]